MPFNLADAKKISPYIFVTVFGTGKIISTIGSSFFALDKLVASNGGNIHAHYNTLLRIMTALSGASSIALTRLPEMLKTYSAAATPQATQHDCNKSAIFCSYLFTTLGYITALLTAMSAYLGGCSITKIVTDDITAMRILGGYSALCSYISFNVYSVSRVTETAYKLGVLLSDSRSQLYRAPDRVALLTLLTSSACAVSTATMFYFSVKHSIPLIIHDIAGKSVLSDKQVEIIAYLSIIPSEATFALSQVASAYKLIKDGRPTPTPAPASNLLGKVMFYLLCTMNAISIPLQGVIYYEYMAEFLQSKGVNQYLLILISCLNALSSAWIYYAFTANRATLYARNIFLDNGDAPLLAADYADTSIPTRENTKHGNVESLPHSHRWIEHPNL